MNDFIIRDEELVSYKGNRSKVIVPDGIKFIGDFAFWDNINLTSVTIPESVVYIGSMAFYGCRNLTDVKLSSNLISISMQAFGNCCNLERLIIPASVITIDKEAFINCHKLMIYCEIAEQPLFFNEVWEIDLGRPIVWGYNNITTHNEYDYVIHENKISLTKYKGNSTVVKIPTDIGGLKVVRFGTIFAYDSNMEYITISENIDTIDDYAFLGCEKLVLARISNSVISIGESAFKDCSRLISLIIPSNLNSIENSTFENCISLTNIEIPNSVTHIGNSAFGNCVNLENVSIGGKVNSIDSNVFYGCINLNRIIFEDTFNWYRTTDLLTHFKREGGILTNMENVKNNATNFKGAYCDCYWYKL